MSDDLAKLEGLAIGLEQRGEKSAAQQVRWAHAEVDRLRAALQEIADGDAYHDGAAKFMAIARHALTDYVPAK